jgi:transcriptional regulator with PAS, ATPase and Fis domain
MENIQHWANEFPSAVTIANMQGVIVYMNEKASATFEKYGGKSLIGKSLYNCHSESSREKLKLLINKQASNTYTIEKNGIKKLIHQSPWYQNGKCAGIVELSIVLPPDMPHFIR